jgi:hypothetical protein
MIKGQADEHKYTHKTSLYFELMEKSFGKKQAMKYWNRRSLFEKNHIPPNEWFLNQTEANKVNRKLNKYLTLKSNNWLFNK